MSSLRPRASRLAFALAATVAAAPAVTTTAGAQLTPGSTLYFTGTADATDIGSPGVILNFDKKVFADAFANTGVFAAFNDAKGKSTSGKIQNILVGNGPQPIEKFLQFGAYRFDLASLPSSGYGQDECRIDPAPGQTCTPYQSPGFELSPFYLVNYASGDPDNPISSTVAFDLIGTVRGPGNAMSSFFGTISTTVPGVPYQYVLYGLEAGRTAGDLLQR